MYQYVLNACSMLPQLQFSPYVRFPKLDPFFSATYSLNNDASVRALNHLTNMKHLKAAFFHMGSGALSSVILRGKIVWLSNQSSGLIHQLSPHVHTMPIRPYFSRLR